MINPGFKVLSDINRNNWILQQNTEVPSCQTNICSISAVGPVAKAPPDMLMG